MLRSYLIFITLLSIIIYSTTPGRNKSKGILFCQVAGILLFLLYALRSPYCGTSDVLRYQEGYELYSSFNFSTTIDEIAGGTLEPGYLFLQWVFGNVFGFQWWLAFIAFLSIGSTMYLVKRMSPIPYISILLFFSLGFMNFEIDGLRQTIAMSILLWAYYPLRDRHLIGFLALVVLASVFHSTALVFILAYPFAYKKIGIIHLGVFIAAAALFFLFKDRLLPILAFFLSASDHFTELYALGDGVSLSMTGFYIQLLLFMFELFFMNRVICRYPNSALLFNLAFIGLCFQLYAAFIGVFFRISLYFSFYHLLLFPMALSVIANKKVRIFVTIAASLVFLAYSLFFLQLSDYGFFWQHVNLTEV